MNTPLFSKVDQLGFVVADIDKAIKLFCDCYGIGPWMRFTFGPKGGRNVIAIENVVLEGETAEPYSIACAVCDMPNGVQLELIQPLDGDSIFSRYLKTHGPGIQHISVVCDFDSTMDAIKNAGLKIGQSALVGGGEVCVFADFTNILGCHVEIHKRPENFTIPGVIPKFYPMSGKMPEDTVPLFTIADQIGIMTPHLKAAYTALADDFGIKPWMLLDFGDCGDPNHVEVENCVWDGEDIGSFSIHNAICEALNIQLEIMEPVSEKGVHALHTRKFGTDVQHISLVCPESYEKTFDRMAAAGYTRCQVSTVDKTETCCYCDHTEILGIYFEIHKRPEVFVPPQVQLKAYPEDAVAAFGGN